MLIPWWVPHDEAFHGQEARDAADLSSRDGAAGGGCRAGEPDPQNSVAGAVDDVGDDEVDDAGDAGDAGGAGGGGDGDHLPAEKTRIVRWAEAAMTADGRRDPDADGGADADADADGGVLLTRGDGLLLRE